MAGSQQNVPRREASDLPFDVCANRTRWRLLRILQLQTGWITEGRLAAKLEAATVDRADANRRYRIQLRHTHLPKLADRNLLVWDEANSRVRGTETTATVVDTLSDLIRFAGGDGPPLDALADERRRTVVALVEAEPEPVSRTRLAREIATGDGDGEPSRSNVREVAIDLHHRQLPTLASAGVVDYDPDDGTVTYTGPPRLPAVLPDG